MYTHMHRYTHNSMIYVCVCVCVDDTHTNDSMMQEMLAYSYICSTETNYYQSVDDAHTNDSMMQEMLAYSYICSTETNYIFDNVKYIEKLFPQTSTFINLVISTT
jgi:hypothetical protein